MDDLARPAVGWLVPDGEGPERCHRRSEPSNRHDRSCGTIQRPVETPERDETDAERYLGVHDEAIERDVSRGGTEAQGTEHRRIREDHDDHAPDDRLLTQSGGAVLQLEQLFAACDEALDGPAGETEESQLLCRLRIDRQPVRIVGVTLGRPHLGCVPVFPDPALAQQPVSRSPCRNQYQRCPPGEADEDDGRGDTARGTHQARGDEVDVEGTSGDPSCHGRTHVRS